MLSTNRWLALFVLLTLFTAHLPAAQQRTWDGGSLVSSNWMDAANWAGDAAPAAGDALVFPPGASRLFSTNNFPAGTLFDSFVFTGSNYMVTGTNVSLVAGVHATNVLGPNIVRMTVRLAADQTFDSTGGGLIYSKFLTTDASVDTLGHTITFDGPGPHQLLGAIIGSGGVIKRGSGSTSFGDRSFYEGPTEVLEGTLSLLNNTVFSALGGTSNGTHVASGATLIFRSSTLGVGIPEPLVLAGTLVGSVGTNLWIGPITFYQEAGATPGIEFFNSSTMILGGSSTGVTPRVTGPGTLFLTNRHDHGLLPTNCEVRITGDVNGRIAVGPGAVLTGTGYIQTIAATGTGTVSPGLPAGFGAATGILRAGAWDLATNLVLALDLNGTALGTNYDHLRVSNSVRLAANTLQVTLGFAPQLGDTFRIVDKTSAGAVQGEFVGLPAGALLIRPFAGTNYALRISYTGGDGNDITLTAVGPPSTITGIVAQTGGAKQITGLGQSGLAYVLEATTNLAPPSWVAIRTNPADGTGVYQFLDTEATNFPARFYRVRSP